MIAIITVGIPASGKSTYAESLSKKHGFYEVNLDNCREKVCGNHTDQSATERALVLHATLIDYQITKGRKIVISDTNLVKKYRNELDDKLTEAGYKVYYVVCNTPFIVCQARNAAREKPVPFFAMTRMQEAMEAL